MPLGLIEVPNGPTFSAFTEEKISKMTMQNGYTLPEDSQETINHLRALEMSRALH